MFTALRLAQVTLIAGIVLMLVGSSGDRSPIQPADQRLAERLNLKFADLPDGWRIHSPINKRFRKNPCPSAPRVQDRITGYVESATFVPVSNDDDSWAMSTTRVFPNEELAKTWFAFAGGGKQASCIQAYYVASWKRSGYAVTGLRHTRQSFDPSCYDNCSYSTRSWQIGFTLSKGENSWTYFLDQVAVRYGRVIVSFQFWNESYSLSEGETLVGRVLDRGYSGPRP